MQQKEDNQLILWKIKITNKTETIITPTSPKPDNLVESLRKFRATKKTRENIINSMNKIVLLLFMTNTIIIQKRFLCYN
jgi:hypothetical protein